MSDIIKKCPMCGRECVMKVTNEQYKRYEQYIRGGQYVQELFPDLNPVEREYIKTGMCCECQEMIFGNGKSDKIKDIWG